ncbi:MAG: SCP2 sterol-binding domain-containing protein [Gammaproteobacteria bacterium]|nr:SCP2 sterol-binding domain-containing protein [Gammaproteobacteria bacterium]
MLYNTIIPFLLPKLESGINHLIRLDPHSEEAREPFLGKVVAIQIEGVQIPFFMQFTKEGICLFLEYKGEGNLSIRGSLYSLLTMGSPLFAARHLHLEGDITFAEALQLFFKHLEPDWEEQLSLWFGDILAHTLYEGGRSAEKWAGDRLLAVRENFTDFIQEEMLLLPPRALLEYFYDEVDSVQSHFEHLESKIDQLKRAFIS